MYCFERMQESIQYLFRAPLIVINVPRLISYHLCLFQKYCELISNLGITILSGTLQLMYEAL